MDPIQLIKLVIFEIPLGYIVYPSPGSLWVQIHIILTIHAGIVCNMCQSNGLLHLFINVNQFLHFCLSDLNFKLNHSLNMDICSLDASRNHTFYISSNISGPTA